MEENRFSFFFTNQGSTKTFSESTFIFLLKSITKALVQSSPSQDLKPTSQSVQVNNCLLPHPKILPLIRRDCQERSLTQNFLQRSLILRSKTSKTITSQLESSLLSPSKKFKRSFVKVLKTQGRFSKLNSCVIFYLSKMTQLCSLKISFQRSLRTTQEGSIIMNPLALLLPKLTQLTQIDLNFAGREKVIQRSSLLNLFQSLQTTKKLSSLSLDLSLVSIVHDIDEETLADCLLCLDPSSMRKLDLDLYENISSKGIPRIFKALQRLTSLDQLRLNLSSCEKMTGKGMSELSLTLRSFVSLSSLCLIFPSKAEAEEIIGNVASALKILRNLQQLKLGFVGQIPTSTSEFQQLFKSLVDLKSLRSLELDFSSNQLINHDILEGFSETLKELTALKPLSLDFQYNGNITNLDVERLSCAIGHLHGLSALTLTFADILGIDEEAIESVARALRSLHSLWSVNLGFFQNILEREAYDLSSLFSALKKKRNIQDVVLFISYSQANNRMINEVGRHKNLTYWWS